MKFRFAGEEGLFRRIFPAARTNDTVESDLPGIFPLFWLKGEPLDAVEAELRAMRAAGIRGFVAESRPFPDWMGPFWWETLDRLLRVAGELGMRMLLFDDKVFPSGRAGGRIAEKCPGHLRTLLETKTRAVPRSFRFRPGEFLAEGDLAVLRAAALPMRPDGRFRSGGEVEVPAAGGDVALPPGDWTLAVWVVTRNGGEELTRDSANLLSAPAVRRLLAEVHEPHFARFRRYAGKTFLGFFSDEPRFGNAASYHALPGKPGTPLPWAPGLPEDGLPRLSFDSDDPAADGRARFAFMDAVSDAWRRNFSETVGGWCRARGLLWTGHAIEDNGAHCRLGWGCGHYFRAMAGQDWAGIDSVLGQNVPDRTEGIRGTPSGPMDDAFFNWGLVKLGASCGELRRIPVAEELFGAYGWSEDLSRMKWHSDFAFARGVGVLVPHAFSCAPFPDPDCPPHFRARGRNPQWRFFGLWRAYAERVADLFRGARRVASPAVVYHAEAEWTRGEGRVLRNEEVVGALARRQIDCGIVPFDSLDGVEVRDGAGIAGDMRIDVLLAADLEGLPASRLDKIGRLRRAGLRVLEISRDDLPGLHERVPPPAFRIDSFRPSLRCRHCVKDGADLLFLFNESMETGVRCRVLSPAPDGFFAMDPSDGSCRPFDGGLDLAPGESLVLLRDPPRGAPAAVPRPRGPERLRLGPEAFRLSVAAAETHSVFSPGAPDDRFFGTVAAEAAFESGGAVFVELPETRCGVLRCFVDGTDCGTRFCTPFRFFCPCGPGRHALRLELTNSPGAAFRGNRFEIPWPPDPPGLRGPVVVSDAS